MSGRILLVDDNPNLTTLLSQALLRFGYEPWVVNDSTLALETARRIKPDLVVLDVMMPEMDGGEVLSLLRSDYALREIPVILLTAVPKEAESIANTGGIESMILGKPVALKVLLEEIRRHLGAAAVS